MEIKKWTSFAIFYCSDEVCELMLPWTLELGCKTTVSINRISFLGGLKSFNKGEANFDLSVLKICLAYILSGGCSGMMRLNIWL